MVIHHPATAAEAVSIRHGNKDGAVYLAGGTDDLRLGGSAEGKELIDINGLGLDTIEVRDGRLYIGARVTLQQLIESELVPCFIKDAARFCGSFVKRNSATVGGNIGARRDDSYLGAALMAADAKLLVQCVEGEKEKTVFEYMTGHCRALIKHVVLDADRTGWVKRFGNTSQSHAAVIGAVSCGIYALSVHGSGFACGETPDLYKNMTFRDDLTGGADYKRYLAETVFTLGR